jgi:hypothetical protein
MIGNLLFSHFFRILRVVLMLWMWLLGILVDVNIDVQRWLMCSQITI